ncbi:acyltransferase family protein [Bradyrhizobium sp. GCM10023182]|uniref:Acyltransferase n=1 Tax=Bradyrhizobium zhengyangense TaxID=2911009 RepID=A0ABS9M207_9BRAD|nr:acyltransferase [Bradyrhizobium zhengyangense]MCG2673304.1 acyltransferase [Bradyrhizobium zhengyangense]
MKVGVFSQIVLKTFLRRSVLFHPPVERIPALVASFNCGQKMHSRMGYENKPDYYPAFDLLRISLALAVAIAHSGINVWYYTGDFAVQVFFALSGWLIGGILLRSAPADLPRFYFHRAARIWIPYAFAILLLVCVSLLKDRITPKWFEFVFYDVAFVYNFFGPPQLRTAVAQMPLAGTGNHFWSICAEEQFYLVAPLLITILAGVGRSIWFWCAVCAIALTCPWWNYFGSISLGVLAAVVRTHIGDWHSRRSAITVLTITAATLFIATYTGLVAYRVGAPLTSITAILLLAQPGRLSRLLVFLGGISFPMYLNHWVGAFVIHAAFFRLGLPTSIYSQLLSVAFGLILSSALYLCLDRVVRRHRDEYYTAQRGIAIAIWGAISVAVGLAAGIWLLP